MREFVDVFLQKEVIKTRQREGIIPHLPAVEDRDSVKNYYQELWSKS